MAMQNGTTRTFAEEHARVAARIEARDQAPLAGRLDRTSCMLHPTAHRDCPICVLNAEVAKMCNPGQDQPGLRYLRQQCEAALIIMVGANHAPSASFVRQMSNTAAIFGPEDAVEDAAAELAEHGLELFPSDGEADECEPPAASEIEQRPR